MCVLINLFFARERERERERTERDKQKQRDFLWLVPGQAEVRR